MGIHSHTGIDDDSYDIDSWTGVDDDDYCYACEDWTDNDGHDNCKVCGLAFDKIEGDVWASGSTAKVYSSDSPSISSTGDLWGRGEGFTWGSGRTSWWITGGGAISSMWGGGFTSSFQRDNDAYRMKKHKEHLDSLCKVVDPNVKHSLSFAHHKSGHTNMSNGHIVIDGGLLKDSDDNLDITAGLAIHEKLHVIHSTPLVKWEKGMRYERKMAVGEGKLLHDICNIIEDEYIERQLAKNCAGFVHYIEACKKHFFEGKYDDMKDSKIHPFGDLINTLLLLVRYPSLIDGDRRKRHAPHIRFFARALSKGIDSRENTYDCMETIYTYLLKAFKKMQESEKDDGGLEDALAEAESEISDMRERFEEDGVSLSDADWSAIEKKLTDDKMKKLKDRDRHRDRLAEAMESIKHISETLSEYADSDELSKDLIEAIEELEETDYSEGEIEASMIPDRHQKKISWETAKQNANDVEVYNRHTRDMKSEISKLKKKIQLYGNLQKLTIRNQKRGKLDKRVLHRIPMGRPDLFKADFVNEDKPLDVCLLVDESGSMGYHYMDKARASAIALKEALGDNEKLNLFVYGHSADRKERGMTEMIEYWSPSMKGRPMAMGGMKARYENRDGNAIWGAAQKVKSESDQPSANKLMIILSDGEPSADMYRGQIAHKHTAKVVKALESRGWNIIQVGFSGSTEWSMKKMFSNYVYCHDVNQIGDKVSKIIRKVLKV